MSERFYHELASLCLFAEFETVDQIRTFMSELGLTTLKQLYEVLDKALFPDFIGDEL